MFHGNTKEKGCYKIFQELRFNILLDLGYKFLEFQENSSASHYSDVDSHS